MTGEGRTRLLLLAACLLLFSYNLGGRDLWEPDEPRYAGIARAIVESGNWLDLSDNGRPYTDKPPLFFWILAASARIGSGVTALSSRVPGSLLALLTVLLVYRLGRDLFNPRVGLFGALVLATTQRYFLEARWVHLDVPLTLLILVTLDQAWRALERREAWRWIVAYGAAGIGCLVKGPVALAVPAAALFTFLASTRELRRWREMKVWYGIPAALLPVSAWLLASSRSAGFDFMSVVRTQVVQRFQEGLHHPRPFYYYLYSLPLEFLPWTLFLAGVLRFTFPGPDRRDRRPLLFLYGWALGGFALFSLAVEKRPSYLLPAFPPLALLTGVFLDEYLVRWDERRLRRWVLAPLGIYALICLGSVFWIPFATRAYPGLGERLVALAVLFLATCAAAIVTLRQGRRGAGLVILLAGIWSGYLFIAGSLLPWLDPYKSARPFCQRVLSQIGCAPLAIYGDYRPAYAFYTHRRLSVIGKRADLERFLSRPGGAFCLVESDDFQALRGQVSIRELDREAVGHRTYLLVASGAREPGSPSPR